MNKPVHLQRSIPELSKAVSFGMIMYNENIIKKQNCVLWIQTISLYT